LELDITEKFDVLFCYIDCAISFVYEDAVHSIEEIFLYSVDYLDRFVQTHYAFERRIKRGTAVYSLLIRVVLSWRRFFGILRLNIVISIAYKIRYEVPLRGILGKLGVLL
jgi:hypothetical protein